MFFYDSDLGVPIRTFDEAVIDRVHHYGDGIVSRNVACGAKAVLCDVKRDQQDVYKRQL